MNLESLLNERHSCRAYLHDQVPETVIEEMFRLAQRTPSWCNTQPWEAHVTSGDATQRFAQTLSEHVLSGGAMSSDLELPAGYSGVHAERRRDSGYGLYNALGIERQDREARDLQMVKNFSFFGAPHTAVITSDREQGPYGTVDSGGYVAILLLAAQSLGLGSIAQAAIAMYSDVVRDWWELPEDRVIVCAVSFGYRDEEHPANQFRTSRADLSEVVHQVRH